MSGCLYLKLNKKWAFQLQTNEINAPKIVNFVVNFLVRFLVFWVSYLVSLWYMKLLSAINHQQSSPINLNNNPAVLASTSIFQPKSIKFCFALVRVQLQCFIRRPSLNFSVLDHLKCCTFRKLNPVTESVIFRETTSTWLTVTKTKCGCGCGSSNQMWIRQPFQFSWRAPS